VPEATAPTGRGVLVVADASLPHIRALMRRGHRLATDLRVPWTAIDVQTPKDNDAMRTIERSQRIRDGLDAARDLGATIQVLQANDWVDGVVRHARSAGCGIIVVGHGRKGFGMGRWAIQHVRDLLDRAGGLEIHIVAFDE
jgi:K+-sensing histidine kinase KdpD